MGSTMPKSPVSNAWGARGAVSSSAAVAVLFARVSKGACVPRGFDLRAWVGLCCPHLG